VGSQECKREGQVRRGVRTMEDLGDEESFIGLCGGKCLKLLASPDLLACRRQNVGEGGNATKGNRMCR